jgi:hypothetical protein
MRFLAKCVLFSCLGIPKSVKHTSEGKKNLARENRRGGLVKPPPLGSRGLNILTSLPVRISGILWMLNNHFCSVSFYCSVFFYGSGNICISIPSFLIRSPVTKLHQFQNILFSEKWQPKTSFLLSCYCNSRDANETLHDETETRPRHFKLRLETSETETLKSRDRDADRLIKSACKLSTH